MNDEPRGCCNYKDFMNCNLSLFNGKEDQVGVIDWISEMEMEMDFVTRGCTGKSQTSYVMRQFKGASICWWNKLRKKLRPNELLQMTSEVFLTTSR